MKKIAILLLTISLLSFAAHKYYLALTEIGYNEETKSVEMIMNLFIDDIEFALNKDYNIDLQLYSEKELKNSDEYFQKYLEEHFKIKINNKDYNYNYIGKEYDGNIVYVYLEIEQIESIENIEIQNDILISYFPQQQNLIKAKIHKKRKSLFLSEKTDKGLLNFK